MKVFECKMIFLWVCSLFFSNSAFADRYGSGQGHIELVIPEAQQLVQRSGNPDSSTFPRPTLVFDRPDVFVDFYFGQFAIANHASYTVSIHVGYGEADYAPESLPDFRRRFFEQLTDQIFYTPEGSRAIVMIDASKTGEGRAFGWAKEFQRDHASDLLKNKELVFLGVSSRNQIRLYLQNRDLLNEGLHGILVVDEQNHSIPDILVQSFVVASNLPDLGVRTNGSWSADLHLWEGNDRALQTGIGLLARSDQVFWRTTRNPRDGSGTRLFGFRPDLDISVSRARYRVLLHTDLTPVQDSSVRRAASELYYTIHAFTIDTRILEIRAMSANGPLSQYSAPSTVQFVTGETLATSATTHPIFFFEQALRTEITTLQEEIRLLERQQENRPGSFSPVQEQRYLQLYTAIEQYKRLKPAVESVRSKTREKGRPH